MKTTQEQIAALDKELTLLNRLNAALVAVALFIIAVLTILYR